MLKRIRRNFAPLRVSACSVGSSSGVRPVQPAVRHFCSEAVEFSTVPFRPIARNWHSADTRERFRLRSIEQNRRFLRMSAPSQNRRTFRFRIQCFWFRRKELSLAATPVLRTGSSSGLRPEVRQDFRPEFTEVCQAFHPIFVWGSSRRLSGLWREKTQALGLHRSGLWPEFGTVPTREGSCGLDRSREPKISSHVRTVPRPKEFSVLKI